MEIEESHRSCKRSRLVANGNQAAVKLGDRDEDEDDGEAKGEINNSILNNNGSSTTNNRGSIRSWHPSSRIFRVSRASGGKDRHSKVYTAKGLRDRRVRLSVSTAIQFYDLQDRLGYDQPSKAIEWLIKAAASAIAELPSLDTTFPDAPVVNHHHVNVEKPMPSDSGMDPEAEPSYNQQQHSSTSETSKGSVLSLSRSEIREKARARAKERVRDKEKDREDANVVSHHVDQSLNSQGSFTKLLTGGSSSAAAAVVSAGQPSPGAHFIQKQMQNLPPVTSTADYFSTQSSLFGQQQQQQPPKSAHQIPTGFSSQTHFGNSSPIGMVPLISSAGDHPGAEMQQFAFLQDHFFPVAAAAAAANGGDYNLNFSISPSLAGFHRGTLQSNSPSHHQHHHHQLSPHHTHHQVQAQRLSSALDGPSLPFFFSAAATAAASGSPSENPYSAGFDGHLQLCDGYKHLELKGKGKG